MGRCHPPLEGVFRTLNPRRDAFLARLFGLFNEEIVRHWCADDRAPYEDLGRPTVWPLQSTRYHTLDFTLRNRATGSVCVAELKCELAWENYRYIRLTAPDQVDHHRGAAFQALLQCCADPGSALIRVRGGPAEISGAILVWGATTPEGREAVMTQYRFADVLSAEEMLSDLLAWGDSAWIERVNELHGWSDELFDYLGSASA